LSPTWLEEREDPPEDLLFEELLLEEPPLDELPELSAFLILDAVSEAVSSPADVLILLAIYIANYTTLCLCTDYCKSVCR
jgi:hypothetical protein